MIHETTFFLLSNDAVNGYLPSDESQITEATGLCRRSRRTRQAIHWKDLDLFVAWNAGQFPGTDSVCVLHGRDRITRRFHGG